MGRAGQGQGRGRGGGGGGRARLKSRRGAGAADLAAAAGGAATARGARPRTRSGGGFELVMEQRVVQTFSFTVKYVRFDPRSAVSSAERPPPLQSAVLARSLHERIARESLRG